MGFKFVLLWTDVALWALFAAVAAYGVHVARRADLRPTWRRVLRDAPALCSALVLGLFLLLTLLDSLHFRRELAPAAGQASDRVFYDTRTESLLDLVLARQIAMRETTYSAPLAYLAITKQTVEREGEAVRELPRLLFGGAHLSDPQTQWRADLWQRSLGGAAAGLAVALLAWAGVAAALARRHGGWAAAARDLLADRCDAPLRALLLCATMICVAAGAVIALMGHYHVFGTDRTGNDVLVQTLKSIRTAFVIGLLSTLATLPFAVVLGILAGWFRGWVDEAVQYLYTLLSSVPNVLLIAACVLMVQVALDKHPEWFETGAERADLKVFLLCVILGVTGWASPAGPRCAAWCAPKH